MARRYEVEVTIDSARDLKNVNWRNGAARPYAVVWIDPSAKSSTKADVDGDTNPTWDEKLVIPLRDQRIEDTVLYIDVVHAAGSGDQDKTKPLIGSARLPLREVVDEVGIGGKVTKSLKLKRPSGRPHGKIDVKVAVKEPGRYHDSYAPPQPYGQGTRDYGQGTRDYGGSYGYGQPYSAAPPAGYPYGYGATPAPASGYGGPPAPASGYGAPPAPAYAYGAPPAPASGYGGPPAPASGYGPPPAPASYGYGTPSAPAPAAGAYAGGSGYGEQKKSKFGMGTGLAVGAAAGILGGLALGEGIEFVEDKIADKAAEKAEDDIGYDDYGGGGDDYGGGGDDY